MISLTCTSCRAVLEIDDAFAGGVCRCQHCGAIQTVPAHLKAKSPEKQRKGQKTLYRKPLRGEAVPSSGLDELAQVLSGSGLSSSRMAEMSVPKRKDSPAVLIGVVAGGLILVLAGVWFALMSSNDGPGSDSPGSDVRLSAELPGEPGPAEAPATPIPAFLGAPVDGNVIIYVLDRGSGTGGMFSHLKEAAYQSVASLGAARKFQIIYWFNGTDDAYPLSGPTYATETNVEAARKALDGIFAFGQSDVGPALTQALAASPDTILLATGKGAQLDEAFVEQVMGIVKSTPLKVHTFDLGGIDISPALKTISQRTGGQAHLISEADLRRLTRE